MPCEAQSSIKKQATLASSEPQGTAPSADYLGHSLHENGCVFGKVAEVNYIFPGFLTTAAIHSAAKHQALFQLIV